MPYNKNSDDDSANIFTNMKDQGTTRFEVNTVNNEGEITGNRTVDLSKWDKTNKSFTDDTPFPGVKPLNYTWVKSEENYINPGVDFYKATYNPTTVTEKPNFNSSLGGKSRATRRRKMRKNKTKSKRKPKSKSKRRK